VSSTYSMPGYAYSSAPPATYSYLGSYVSSLLGAPIPVVVVQLTIGSPSYEADSLIYDDVVVYDVPAKTYYFSDVEYGDDGTNWHHARLINDIAYSREGLVFLWGERSKGSGLGNIEIINDDGAFDFLVTDSQSNARVAVFEVSQDKPMSEAIPIAAGRVLMIEAQGESTVRLVTGDILADLDVPLQTSLYADGDGVDTLIGRPRPVVLGSPVSCPIVLVDDVDYDYDCHDNDEFTVSMVRDSGFPLNVGTLPGEGYKLATDPGIHGITLLQMPVGRIVADVSTSSASSSAIIGAAEGDFDADLSDWDILTETGGGASSGTASATWASGQAVLDVDKLSDGPFDGLAAYASLRFPTELLTGVRYTWSVDAAVVVDGEYGYALFQVFFEPTSLLPSEYVTLVSVYDDVTDTYSGSFTAPANGRLRITAGAAYGAAVVASVDSVRLTRVNAGSSIAELLETLLARAGVGIDQVDATSLATLAADRPWNSSYWADSSEKVSNLVDQLLVGICGYVYTDPTGKIAIGYLQPPEVGESVLTITEAELAGEIEVEPDLAPNLSTTVAGARNWYSYSEGELADALSDADRALLTADFRIRRTSTSPVGIELRNRAGSRVSEESISGIPTLLDDEANVQAAANYMSTLYPAGQPRRFYNIPVFMETPDAAARKPGEKITLIYPRYGCGEGRELRIVGIYGRAGDSALRFRCWGSAVD